MISRVRKRRKRINEDINFEDVLERALHGVNGWNGKQNHKRKRKKKRGEEEIELKEIRNRKRDKK